VHRPIGKLGALLLEGDGAVGVGMGRGRVIPNSLPHITV